MKLKISMGVYLAAFLIFSGCATEMAKVQNPYGALSRLDAPVSPQERASFLKDLSEVRKGPRAARARYFLGLAAYQDGKYPEAQAYFKTGAADSTGGGWELACLSMNAMTLEKQGDLPGALALEQRLKLPLPATQQNLNPPSALAMEFSERAGKEAARLIGSFSLADVEKASAAPSNADLLPELSLRKIALLVADKKNEEAFAAIAEYFKRFPQAPTTAEVNRLLLEADKALPVDRNALGLLLPLSGAQAAYGAQARQGAELALEALNAKRPEGAKLHFVVADEGSDSQSAADAASKLLIQSQVMGVVGPMSSEACIGILGLAASRHTLFLSPSAIRPDLGEISPYFFRNCLTPEKQGAAMADYATYAMKVTRVAGLYPDTTYSTLLMTAFSKRMVELGGAVVVSLSYTAGSSDFKDYAVALGGVNPTLLKDADMAEKRDQQAKVEAASTKLGQYLLNLKTELEASAPAQVSPVADATAATTSGYQSLTFPAKVAVVDFYCATAAAQFNAGRAFSDRFWRVLSQLDELKLISPDETSKRLRERGLQTGLMNPTNAADFARTLGADFYLGGTVNEVLPDWNNLSESAKRSDKEGRIARADLERFSKNQVFQVTVQLIDARTGQIAAWQQFEVTKMKPQTPNALGLQALYFPGTAVEVLQAASALKFCDMKVPLLGSDLWDRPSLFRSDDVATLEGACFSSGFFPESQDNTVRQFVSAYRLKFAAVPNLLSAQAYDATLMLGELLAQGAETREGLRQGLLGLKNFDGVSGRSSFDGQHDAAKRIPILKVNSVSKTLEQVQ